MASNPYCIRGSADAGTVVPTVRNVTGTATEPVVCIYNDANSKVVNCTALELALLQAQ